MKIINALKDFQTFHTQTKDLDPKNALKIWRKLFEKKYGKYINELIYQKRMNKGWKDTRIKCFESFLTNYPKTYQQQVSFYKRANKLITKSIKSFKKIFPDANFDNVTFFIAPSLFTYNGKVEALSKNGKALIFGIGPDVIASMSTNGSNLAHNDSVFFAHELFHLYHYSKLKLTENDLLEGKILHCAWVEGLAVYASTLICPRVHLSYHLMDKKMKPIVDKQYKYLLNRFKNNCTSQIRIMGKESKELSTWFSRQQDKKVPERAGYYLGYLLAKEIAKKYGFNNIINWKFNQVEKPIIEALKNL